MSDITWRVVENPIWFQYICKGFAILMLLFIASWPICDWIKLKKGGSNED